MSLSTSSEFRWAHGNADLAAAPGHDPANPPRVYYIAVGEDDFVKKLNDDFRHRLDNAGYEYIYNLSEGGHTWQNWRRYLVDFLPRLF